MGKALGRKSYQTVQNSFFDKLGVLPRFKKKRCAINQMKLVVLIYGLILARKAIILEGEWHNTAATFILHSSKQRSGERKKKLWTILISFPQCRLSLLTTKLQEVCQVTRDGLKCSVSCLLHAVDSCTLCRLFLYLCHPTSARTIDCYTANFILLLEWETLLIGKLVVKITNKPHKHSREWV